MAAGIDISDDRSGASKNIPNNKPVLIASLFGQACFKPRLLLFACDNNCGFPGAETLLSLLTAGGSITASTVPIFSMASKCNRASSHRFRLNAAKLTTPCLSSEAIVCALLEREKAALANGRPFVYWTLVSVLHGTENENIAPGSSLAVAHRRPCAVQSGRRTYRARFRAHPADGPGRNEAAYAWLH
jgi:hypothetical protein